MGRRLSQGLAIFILLVFPFTASSHPGKTDVRDGHKCWKNCYERGLEKGEYHLHDKNRNAIRLHQEEVPVANQIVGEAERPYTSVVIKDLQRQVENEPDQTAAAKADVPAVREGSAFPFNLLILAFIALCLLLMLALIRRKKKNDR